MSQVERNNKDVFDKFFEIDKIEQEVDKIGIVFFRDEVNKKWKGIVKDNQDKFLRTFKEGEYVRCLGKLTNPLKNEFELLSIAKSKKDPEVLVNPAVYKRKLKKFINTVKDGIYKSVLEHFFNTPHYSDFYFYPATTYENHNYQYGLLQHSVEVVDIAFGIAKHYKEVDLDLLCCCCLIHDLGIIYKFSIDPVTNEPKTTEWQYIDKRTIIGLLLAQIHIDFSKKIMLYNILLGKDSGVEQYIFEKANNISKDLNR